MTTPEHSADKVQTDGKSAALAISFSMLLLLAISVISLSFWSAAEYSHDAIAINLAGRQRMLPQRIEKELLQLKIAKQKYADISLSRKNLSQSCRLFDQTLTLFGEGTLTDNDGNKFTLTSARSINTNGLIIQAQAIWEPMRAALQPIISSAPNLSDGKLDLALSIFMRDNQRLLQLMDSITGEIENAARKKSDRLRITEAAAIGLILVNFGFVLFYFRRQLTLLSESKLLSMRILEKVGTAIIVLNAKGDIELCNHAAENMFGYSTGKLSRKNIKDLLEEPYFLQTGKRINGERFTLDIDITQICVSGRTLLITSLYDQTEQKLKEEQLIHLAYHDPLTELPNRLLFMDRLAQTIARAHRNSELAAILFIDLDRFKQVNDTLGHAIGDLLLQNVSSSLKSCLREGDTLARLGGDEFTMIVEASDLDICVIVTKRILSELNREFNLDGHNIQISGSIGAWAVSSTKCNKVKLICPVSLKVKSAFRKEYFSRAFPF